MKYFIQVTLTTYVAAMLVYALWSYITFQTLDKGWVGSLVYLPHGCRVVFYCFFGTRSLPALYLAEISILNLLLLFIPYFFLYRGPKIQKMCFLPNYSFLAVFKLLCLLSDHLQQAENRLQLLKYSSEQLYPHIEYKK